MVFLQYAIVIEQNWSMYMYVSFVHRGITTYLLYKSTHFYEDVVYVINSY